MTALSVARLLRQTADAAGAEATNKDTQARRRRQDQRVGNQYLLPDEVGDDADVVAAAVQEGDEGAGVEHAERHQCQPEPEAEEYHEAVLSVELDAQADPDGHRGDDDFLDQIDQLQPDDAVFQPDHFACCVGLTVEEFVGVAGSGDNGGRDECEDADDVDADLDRPILNSHVDRDHTFDKEQHRDLG